MSKTIDTLKSLWAYFDMVRGQEPFDVWKGLRKLARQEIQGDLTPDVIESLFTSTASEQMGEYTTPSLITDFMAALSSRLNPSKVIDPMCGSGVMLQMIQSSSQPKLLVGSEKNVATCEVARSILNKDIDLFCGNFFQSPHAKQDDYDLIATDPPMGCRVDRNALPEDLQMLKLRELAQYLVIWACRSLSSRGVIAVVMAPSALQYKAFLEAIHTEGCRVRASLHVPAGTRLNTGIPSQVLIIEHGPQKDVFVGRLSENEEQQKKLLHNLFKRKSDKHPSLGRLCKLERFVGYEALEADYRLREQLRGLSLAPYKFQNLVKSEARHSRDADASYGKSDAHIFLPQSGTRFYSAPSELPANCRRFSCYELNTDEVLAPYLLRWLESSHGKTALIAAGGSTLYGPLRMNSKTLDLLVCYLPSVDEQKSALKAHRKLEALRAELNEIESCCWTGELSGNDLLSRAETLNQEDRYEDWLESLPFPLASILWRHKISAEVPQIKLAVLLHFFEAFAAFLATLHLSAFTTHDKTWREHQPKLLDRLQQQGLSLERASFGTWRVVAESLAAVARKMLKDGERSELVHSMYAVNNTHWLTKLFDPSIATIISTANRIRNTHGHGGAIGDQEAIDVENELWELVEQVRNLFGREWQKYELIQADKMSYENGSFVFQAPRLMGTRNQFERVSRTTSTPLETGKLYLLGEGEREGLQLLSFVRVMQSPNKVADACYFYNREEKEGVRFVSYHFEQESKVCDRFESTANTIRQLTTIPDLPIIEK